jgi:hypothetical protein
MPFGLAFAVGWSRSRALKSLICAAALPAALLGAGAQSSSSVGIDTQLLLRDLQVLSSDDMQGRLIGSPGGIKARGYIVERFKALGLDPFSGSYVQPFALQHGANVVGRIRGLRQPAMYIVVSAHYDHVGVRGGQIYNGADDNASGTAALMALAAEFKQHPPEHSIIFAAFDGEEEGLVGSHAFVQHPPVELSAIAINVNLDMIGRDPKGNLFAVGTFLNPFLKPYVDRVASTAPVHLLIGHDNPAQKGVEDWTKDSDHWSFQQAKIPAIYLGDEDFAQHHEPTDDYETITTEFFVGATKTALALVKEFDRNLDEINRARSAR